jgi:hypothetical protein
VCGVHTKSTTLIKAMKSKDDVKLLTKQEIDILAERFEIGGRVHYGHFIQFFKEMNNSKSFNRTKSYKAVDGSVQSRSTRPKQSVGLSPFRMSSEWASLKEEVFKNKTYKLNDNSRPLDSVSERGKSTYRGQSSTDIRNSYSKGRIEMLSEEDDDEQPYDQSSPQTLSHNSSSKQNFRERVRDRRDSRSSAGQDEWRASKDRNLGPSSPSDSKYLGKNKDNDNNNNNTKTGERGRSQKKLVNNSDLSDGKKNVPPPKPPRNIPGKRNDALVENSPKKNSEEIRKNSRNRDNSDGYYNNKHNSNNNHYNNNSNSNDDDDDHYNRGMSDKKRAILGDELDFKSDSRGRSDSPRDLRDRNKNNNNNNNNRDNDRRRNSNGSDRGRSSERGRRSPSEAKNIQGKDRGSERDRDRERGSERGRERRSRSPDGRSSPENVAVNRRSWRRSLTDSMMWTKSQTMLVDDDDTSGPLKLPQRAQSPEGKGVAKYFPWNRRSGGDSGRSSPVAL